MATQTQVNNTSNIPFFFILGRPRAGTTLLQSILDAHPNVIIPNECEMIMDLFIRYSHLNTLDDSTIEILMDSLKEQPKIEFWPIHFDKVKQNLQAIKGDFNFQNIIRAIYIEFQSAFEKEEIRMFGDKNPAYSMYPNLFLNAFPQAKFLCISRDYRDNYLSIKKSGLMNGILIWIVYGWRISTQKIDHLIKSRPNQFFSFKYEDFIQKPDSYMEEICKFLEIPVSHGIIERYQNNKKVSDLYPQKKSEVFHKKIYQPVDPNNFDKWKTEMSDREIMMADLIVGETAELAGYERQYKTYPLQLRFHVFIRILVIKSIIWFRNLKRLLPLKYRRAVGQKMPKVGDAYLYFFKK